MSISNEFHEYKRELELIFVQNPIECELYSVIACLIRNNAKLNISVRDVSSRRKSKSSGSEIFTSDSGFPDLIILSEDFRLYDKNNKDTSKIFGAIEMKRMTLKLDDKSKQVSDHIKRFKKVIFTNGFDWWFYNKDKCIKIKLGRINRSEIEWSDLKVWNNLLGELKKIEWDKS